MIKFGLSFPYIKRPKPIRQQPHHVPHLHELRILSRGPFPDTEASDFCLQPLCVLFLSSLKKLAKLQVAI